ncbi:aminotransferase class IV [Microbacterium sp. ZXX196]|uniref:aminotransferase class IV n=1 Tax=Microbacterium sp. ZXX196 TaxID=2609291 RepID=UPI0012B727E2|nr:aminotransferase class IV [Microbacterium sp. ZXX196]MTE23592.1 aminodeoxychorismate lyase [Microbacterium sp. ZXX196]
MAAVTFRFPYPAAGSAAPDLVAQPVDAPTISVMDAAAERGDGAFETFGVVGGAPQAVRDHLERLRDSLAMLELPAPDLPALAEICRKIAARATGDAWLKLVVTRGGMDRAAPSAWAVLADAADTAPLRAEGIAVVTADRGFASDYAEREPWALIGAKTLSYAQNMAAIREAHRRGAGDMLWATSDGLLLEAPTSSLVVLRGSALVTPDPRLGALHGTTQRAMFRWAEAAGLETTYARLTRADLASADAAWLASSVRGAVPISRVDGSALPIDRARTEEIAAFLRARRD